MNPLFSLLSMAILFLFLATPVHAQATTTSDVWEAIKRLENAFIVLSQKVTALAADFTAFSNDTTYSLDALVDQDSNFSTQLGESNGRILDLETDTATHAVLIDDLNQTDQGLQSQIDGIQTTISRDRVYEVMNNDFNSYFAFCDDPTDILLFGYCSGNFMGQIATGFMQLFDDFNDFDLTTNPTWNILYGNFVVGPPSSGSSAAMLVCVNTSVCEAVTTTLFTTNGLRLESTIYANQPGDLFYIGATDKSGQLGQSQDDGYFIRAFVNGDNSALNVYRLDDGSATSIASSPGVSMLAGVNHHVRAERSEAGSWQLYLDGLPAGNGPNDTTYQTFSFTHVLYDGAGTADAGRMDDIQISRIGTGMVPSAIQNVSDLNASLGIRCQSPGTARVLCLRQ